MNSLTMSLMQLFCSEMLRSQGLASADMPLTKSMSRQRTAIIFKEYQSIIVINKIQIKMSESFQGLPFPKTHLFEASKITMNSFLFKKIRYKSYQGEDDPDSYVGSQERKSMNWSQKSKRKNSIIRSRIKSNLNEQSVEFDDNKLFKKSSQNVFDKVLKWNLVKNKNYRRKSSSFSSMPSKEIFLKKKKQLLQISQRSRRTMGNINNKLNKPGKSLKSIEVEKINIGVKAPMIKVEAKAIKRMNQKVVRRETMLQKKQKISQAQRLKLVRPQKSFEECCPWSSRQDESEIIS